MIKYTRPTWAEVSRSRLVANYHAAIAAAGNVNVLAVIKANAYGHGSPECAQILAAAGAKWLGVTSVEEGIEVRNAANSAGFHPEILIMCGASHGEAAAILDHKLTPIVWEPYHLDLLEAELSKRAATINVHLEIDTGMSRVGAGTTSLPQILRRLQQSPLNLSGVMTHFACAEVANAPLNHQQLARFTTAVEQVFASGLRPEWVHAGASSTVDVAIELAPIAQLAARFKARPMPRMGIALYGYVLPAEDRPGQLAQHLHPVLTWKTRILSLRELEPGTPIGYSSTYIAPRKMRLALLPVGYADGFRRELSNTGSVLLKGQHAPITGRVSMDLTIVDVTDIEGVTIGEEAVLLGSQGNQQITAADHACLAGTIPYEILCGIAHRVPRYITD